MRTSAINIRDPYVLLHEGVYYLYGTRSETCWGKAEGFDCYKSRDLEEWEGPTEIFHRPEGFFADREYWAPECIAYRGAFYLVVTFGGENCRKGCYLLRSEHPAGPFSVYSERLTPADQTCLDGTIYLTGDRPLLFFSRSLPESPAGEMCALPLTEDLRAAADAPTTLFVAAQAPWAKPVPFAREEFGVDGPAYFTDGPSLFSLGDGRLYMTWSSWSENGYAVGAAVSERGDPMGPWRQMETPIFPGNGGHGMTFRDREGKLRFVLHHPNTKGDERPLFAELVKDGEGLKLRF